MAENKAFDIEFFTDGSTAPNNPGISGWGWYATDDLGTKIDGYGAVGTYSTNNVSELTAFIRALEYALTIKTIKTITVNCDSRYVLDGHVNMVKGRDAFLNTPDRANIPVWSLLAPILDTLTARKIKVKTKWVKGHSGIEGNERADRNADKGRLLNGSDNPTDVTLIEKGTDTKRDLLPKPIMLAGTKFVFYSNAPRLEMDKHLYMSVNFKKFDKDTAASFRYLGKEHADTTIALLFSGTSYRALSYIMDTVDEGVNTITKNAYVPTVVNLPNLYKAPVWRSLTFNGMSTLSYNNGLVLAPDNSTISAILTPPKNVFKLIDTFKIGIDLYKSFIEGDNALVTKDITHLILSTNSKGRQTLNGGIKPGDDTLVVNDVIINGTEQRVGLDIGLDMPIRNVFSGLLKEDKERLLSLHLVIWEIGKRRYRCGTILKCGDDIGVYYTPYASSRLISR